MSRTFDDALVSIARKLAPRIIASQLPIILKKSIYTWICLPSVTDPLVSGKSGGKNSENLAKIVNLQVPPRNKRLTGIE